MAKTPAWQRAAGKNPEGGLNEKGRASLRAAGHDIKRPQPEGGPRKRSFCARMEGMKRKNTSAETANDPDSRINKSLRKWKCADGGPVDPYDSVQQAAKGGPIWDKPRPKKLGKPEPLSSKEKASAKASAKAAGRLYPNLVDNMRAARADGGELIDPYDAVQNAANTDGKPPYGGDLEQNQKISGISPAPNDYLYLAKPSSQPIENAKQLEIGNLQRQITPSFAENVISKSHEQAAAIADKSPNIVASDQMITPQLMESELSRSGRREPLDVNQNIATSSAYGTSTVTDPEGRTGHPVFVAGTTPTGQNVPLNSGQQAVMAAHLARIYKNYNPSGDYNAITNYFPKTQSELTPEGKSAITIGINTGYKERPESFPHELGHAVADYQTRFDNPLEGASPEALAQFRNMVRLRQDVDYKNRPDLKEYVNRPQEQWAEGFRGYITDPKMFKQTYPDAARFMRGIINTDPRINKLLNLSRNNEIQGIQSAANGGEVEGDVQFAPDDPYAKVQEAANLPMMARNDFAMRMPQPEVRYDTGPQPGESTLKAYDPTIKERIYQGIAGTEERPSPERAQFARGVSQMAEFAPVLGNVMAGQEAQRRGDTKGMLMAALPVPGMATEARMAEAAISPAQEAAREAYQRVLNAQGLYSHAAEAAANLPQAKGSYEQMMAMLQKAGVKPEEMRWSGVEQFAGQPVTREQLVSHFEQNAPKIEETVLGSPDETKLNEADAAVREAIRAYNEGQVAPRYYATNPERIYSSSFFPTREEAEAHIPTLPASYHAGTTVAEFPGKPIDVYETMRRLHNGEFVYNLPPGVNRAALNLIDERNALAEAAEQSGTKFGQYTLPGGQNYREVLLHQPPSWEPKIEEKYGRFGFVGPDNKFRDYWTRSEAEQAARSFKRTSGDFTSQHWDQPNVLGHLRMSDRTGPEGEKILHLEELQSDWGQEGRKQGFETKEMREAKDKAKKEFNDYSKQLAEKYDLNPAQNLAMYGRLKNMDPSEVNKYEELQRIASESGAFKSKIIPSAPYVESTKNWVDLGLKRALKEAAEGGYSKMVWTPGEEQAARYDIGKQVSHIQYNPETGMLVAADKRGTPVVRQEVHRNRLPEFIGKEAAEKLLNNKMEGLPLYELKGEDLQFGGQGMKSFYDKMVPTRLKELLKKIDPQAKMSMTEINGEEGPIKVPTVEITPKIREAVKKGLPLYAKGGEVVNNADPYDNIQLAAKISPRARRASK